MARPNQYNKGFAAGIAAAVEFIRTQGVDLHKRGQCNPHQLAEWHNVAGRLEAADIAPVKNSDPVSDAIVEVIDHPERD